MWRGWTTFEQASAYEQIVRGQVIPEIEARRIPGFEQIDLLRHDEVEGVLFVTLMWFDELASIKRFTGEDDTISQVPDAARAVLTRFDERATHFIVLDRRPQGC